MQSISAAFHATSGPGVPQETKDRLYRQAEQASGYCAVAVIGPETGWPITIAVSMHPRDVYRTARRWNYQGILVHALAWCQDRAQAERLAAILETLLAAHQRPSVDRWYDLDAALVVSQIDRAAEKASVRVFDEIERRQRLELVVERTVGRIARDIDGSRAPNVVSLPRPQKTSDSRE